MVKEIFRNKLYRESFRMDYLKILVLYHSAGDHAIDSSAKKEIWDLN